MTELAIVHCSDYYGRQVDFLMEKNDFRYNRGEYTHVADAKVVRKMTPRKYNDPESIIETPDGKKYYVFQDWSVKEK